MMKKTLLLGFLLAFCAFLIPLAATPGSSIPAMGQAAVKKEKDPVPLKSAVRTFRILNHETGTVTEMPADEYIVGVVAAEMPAGYETEALKAQAVAGYTFACRRRQTASGQNYDLSTDPTSDQAFVSAEERAKKWGDREKEYTEKIQKAVRAVSGQILTYDGKPALTVYHAISPGRTESAENVWGNPLPYLIAADSPFDRTDRNFQSFVRMTPDELREKLKDLCTPSGDPAVWFGAPTCSPSGTVLKIPVSGTVLTGQKIRSALGLRSAAFTVTWDGESFTFCVSGYGHGVGMSQVGANGMAGQGSTYREILNHYYPGCTVETVD